MKNISSKITIVFLVVVFIALGSKSSFAQRVDLSMKKVFEYSLMSLRNSAMEVTEKNRWLKDQSKELRKKIRTLSTEVSKLEDDRMKWVVQTANIDGDIEAEQKEFSIFENNLKHLSNEMSGFVKEQRIYEKKLVLKKAAENKLVKEIAHVSGLVEKLEDQVSLANENVEIGRGSLDIEKYLESIEKNNYEIKALEKQLSKLTRHSDDPMTKVKKLAKENSYLKKQFSDSQKELKMLASEKNVIQKEIDNIDKEKDVRREELLSDIDKLNKEKESIVSILTNAKEKLKKNRFDLKAGKKEEKQLVENFSEIRKERDDLKKRVVSLEKELEIIKSNR